MDDEAKRSAVAAEHVEIGLAPCPACGAPWERTELTGEAHRGGGYHVLCHACGHEWDDLHASHGDRETARRRAARSARILTPEEISARQCDTCHQWPCRSGCPESMEDIAPGDEHYYRQPPLSDSSGAGE